MLNVAAEKAKNLSDQLAHLAEVATMADGIVSHNIADKN